MKHKDGTPLTSMVAATLSSAIRSWRATTASDAAEAWVATVLCWVPSSNVTFGVVSLIVAE
ncbi:MAG: hypothetical protein LBE08_11730 [Bifidobacteriaceae bacterium]|jgi:hypothetical protein|nr:hypothetical protein [Bifidobacteriaceae bacterium]